MAKGSNLITKGLSGKLGDMVFVKSNRYEEHVRRKRGTVKPAVLNDSMKQSSVRLASANLPAKAIFDAVRGHHKDGELWNKLFVLFRRQLKAGIPFRVDDLKELECHEKFTLSKLMTCTGYTIQIAQKADKLCIDLQMNEHPRWTDLEWVKDCQYRLSILVVYPNFENGSFITETAHGPITAFKAPVEPVFPEVPIPALADKYVAFLLAAVCENGIVAEAPNTRGMGVVGVGERAV